jgi:membrane-bound serine protease (ClpP class)
MTAAALADPNLAFVLLVIGLIGIYWELHAPGMVAPGLLGVMLVCVAASGLAQDLPTWHGATLITLAVLLLLIEFKYYSHSISGLAGTILLCMGAITLLRGPRQISPALAIAVSAACGSLVIYLGFLGMRAQAKPLSGLQALVGELGRSCTDLQPEGTVFVHGEYWRARAPATVPSGRVVRVDTIEELMLTVREETNI